MGIELAKEDLNEMSRDNLIRFAKWLKIIPTIAGIIVRLDELTDIELREEIDAKINPPVGKAGMH